MVIIDAHTHIGYWDNLYKTKRCLLKSMKKWHINKAVFSMDASEFENEDPNSNLHNDKVIHMKQLEIAKTALKFCKRHRNLYMLIWIKPYFEKNIQELEEFYLKNKKYIKGLKIHPYMSHLRVTDRRLIPYFNFAKKYKLPILVHTADDEYSKIKYLQTVAKKYPSITFIAAHMELLSDNQNAIEIIKKQKNIFGDTAWVDINTIQKCKDEDILDKIMFGTDCPIDGYKTYSNPMYLNYFNNSIKLNQIEYGLLMHVNAERIYKLNVK